RAAAVLHPDLVPGRRRRRGRRGRRAGRLRDRAGQDDPLRAGDQPVLSRRAVAALRFTLVTLGGTLGGALLGTATAHADRVVALVPLTTLGTEDTSASSRALAGELEAAVAALPGT